MRTIIICLTSLLPLLVNAADVCTPAVKIYELKPRDGGWVHIISQGITNMDLKNCGRNDLNGMLLNYNDNSGSLEGKKMLYATLLAAFNSGKSLKLCSAGCDSQQPAYSRLSYINELRQ